MKCTSVCYQSCVFLWYILFKAIGLSPWTKSALLKARNFENKFKFSYIGTFYNVFISVAINIFLIYTALNASITQDIRKWKPHNILAILAHVSLFWSSLVQISYTVRQKLMISVGNQLRSVNTKLEKCANYERRNNYFDFVIFFLNGSFILSLYLLKALMYDLRIKLFILSIPYLISNCHIVQYTTSLNSVIIRFKMLNSTLLKMYTSKSKIVRSRNLILTDIERIKQSYVGLFNICRDMESFFGFPCLIITLVIFVRLIFNLFCIILVVIDIEIMHVETYYYAIFTAHTILLFTTLTTTVTKLINQRTKTAKIVNLLMNRLSKYEEIHQKLAKFSKDLLDLDIEFTLCDMIPLDRSLLAIITGTISTYLIITIQFFITSANK